MKRAKFGAITRGRWLAYKLPVDMTDKSFLDIGCWAGGFVREAVEKGSYWAKGIDAVYDADWEAHKLAHIRNVKFEVMDVMSFKFLEITVPYDIVLCSGVLYHVSDPVGLMRRLRVVTKELCVVETAVSIVNTRLPVLQYCPGDSFDRNPSNWFLPNIPFLREITEEVGFEIEDSFPSGGGRLCLHLKSVNKALTEKDLPRRKEYMKP
jgi:tRNA (mo5U34)-methyltransferase